MIHFGFGGTATNGTDYGVVDDFGTFSPFPDSLLLEPGNNGVTINVVGNDDGNNEDNEEIIIYVYINDCVAGQIAVDSIVLTLHDDILVDIFPDTLVCPNELVNLTLNYDVDTAAIDNIFFSADTSLPISHFLMELDIQFR